MGWKESKKRQENKKRAIAIFIGSGGELTLQEMADILGIGRHSVSLYITEYFAEKDAKREENRAVAFAASEEGIMLALDSGKALVVDGSAKA